MTRNFFVPLLCLLAVACGGSEEAPGSAAQEAPASVEAEREFASSDGLYRFSYPAEWTAEAVHEGGLDGTLVMAPEEGGWQANLFFSTGTDPENRTVLAGAQSMAPNLAREKSGFELIATAPVTIADGEAARVVYSNDNQGLKLLGWDVVAARPGSTERVFVTVSASYALRDKYVPKLEKVLASLRVGGGKE